MTNQTQGYTPKHWDGTAFTKQDMLHAAAPELLEALKDISDRASIFWLNNNMRQHKSDGIGALVNQIKTIAENAIFKAEGKG